MTREIFRDSNGFGAARRFLGVFIHWTGVDWTGLDWTGVEWTGLTQKSVKCLFQCRTEAKHTYSVTKVACTACFRVFAESVEVKGHVHI